MAGPVSGGCPQGPTSNHDYINHRYIEPRGTGRRTPDGMVDERMVSILRRMGKIKLELPHFHVSDTCRVSI